MMNNNQNIQQGYKDSPLGIIPQEWEVKRLGEICKESRLGGNYENAESNTGIPVIKMGNIGRGKIVLDKIQYLLSNECFNETDVLKSDDLLFNTRNTLELVGKVAIWKNELPFAIYNSNLLRLYFHEHYVHSNEFMNLSFNSHFSIKQLRGYATGTTSVAAIYSRDLLKMKFAIPPLGEQRRIAEVLGCWDEAIERQGRMVELLTTRKRALMQQLLTPHRRLPNFSEPWKTTKLGEIAERVTRKNTENNLNVMTISAQRGFVSQTDFFNKSIASEITDSYFLVHKDEFCYNKSYCNGYPMGAIKRLNSAEKAVVTTLYICFRIKCDKCNIEFLEQYFEAGLLNKNLMKIANEGGRAHGLLNVTPSDFFAMSFEIPSFDEQRAIAEALTTADREIELATQNLTALRSQKRALMQQLLTGKKRLQLQ